VDCIPSGETLFAWVRADGGAMVERRDGATTADPLPLAVTGMSTRRKRA
jgi:hypothetical protein